MLKVANQQRSMLHQPFPNLRRPKSSPPPPQSRQYPESRIRPISTTGPQHQLGLAGGNIHVHAGAYNKALAATDRERLTPDTGCEVLEVTAS